MNIKIAPLNKKTLSSMATTSVLFSFMFVAALAAPTASASTPATSPAVTSQQNLQGTLKKNPLVKDVQTVVDILSAGVGVIVVIMIIVGGIQYSIAGDNPQALTAAKKRITNALIALVAFMFMFAFLQWLIPGGIFG